MCIMCVLCAYYVRIMWVLCAYYVRIMCVLCAYYVRILEIIPYDMGRSAAHDPILSSRLGGGKISLPMIFLRLINFENLWQRLIRLQSINQWIVFPRYLEPEEAEALLEKYLYRLYLWISGTVSIISSGPHAKMAMPDAQRNPEKRCLIKY